MDNDFEKIIQSFRRSVTLTACQRAANRAILERYVEDHPGAFLAKDLRETSSISFWFVLLKRYTAAAVILMLFVGGGLSVAAEGALPGDLLYPVKIYLGEPVRGFFLLRHESRALWQEQLALRRLNELLLFTVQKKEEVPAPLKKRLLGYFSDHEKRFRNELKVVSRKEPKRARASEVNFEGKVAAHREVLRELESAAGGGAGPTDTATPPRGQEKRSDGLRGFASPRTESVLKAAGKGAGASVEERQRAFQKIAEAQKVFAEVDAARQSAFGSAKEAYGKAEALFAGGELLEGQGNYKEAIIHYEGAEREAEKAVTIIRIKKELKLGVFSDP